MYILGGYTDDSFEALVGQMFSLDLSKSWSTSNPAFKSLPNRIANAAIPNSLTTVNQNWFIISNQTAYLHNFGTSSWSTLSSGGRHKCRWRPFCSYKPRFWPNIHSQWILRYHHECPF